MGGTVHNIASRAEARAAGQTHYFTGKPCGKGHVALRFVSTCQCFECVDEHRRSRPTEKKKATRLASYKANKERENRRSLQWQIENRERRNAKSSEWQKTSEKARAIRRRHRVSKKNDPKYILCRRMRDGLRRSLLSSKGGRSWESLVGYTAVQLRHHIEAQFLPGMTWENAASWHIDHIVPVAAFDFASAGCSDFAACWALGNLRPMWALENKKKGAARQFLL